MHRIRSWIFGAALSLVPFTLPAAAAQECELDRPVVFAGLNWDSNAFHTEVARHIIEAGYGCRTEVVPGSTLPLHTGMQRGDVDVAMEIWSNVISEPWRKGLKRGLVAELGVNFPDTVQGWFVPRFVVEGDAERGIEPMAPDLKSVFDLPRYKKLFKDPENRSKGRFLNCVFGWLCEVINTKKLKAYGLDDDFNNVRVGSGAALAAAISGAYRRGEPVLAYYWGPTRVLAVHDLLKLEEPPYDEDTWNAFMEERHPDKAVAYPPSPVKVGVNTKFKEAAPTLVRFLTAYETETAHVLEALAYLEKNEGSRPKDAALHFLKTREDVWRQWVSEEVAERVAQSLD
ncbi:MAG: ABC transporter substrate-binding protein [Alphaproteobacteria bacterium]